MEKEIDWSKAPEGATHFNIGNRFWEWMKLEEGDWFFWHGKILEWRKQVDQFPLIDDVLIQRKESSNNWDGTGLPPVGIECIAFGDDGSCFDSARVRILAHADHDGDPAVLFALVGEDGRLEEMHAWIFVNGMFRTPEQIAAEERQKAVNEMADAVSNAPSSFIPALYALYDAGYRKIEN